MIWLLFLAGVAVGAGVVLIAVGLDASRTERKMRRVFVAGVAVGKSLRRGSEG